MLDQGCGTNDKINNIYAKRHIRVSIDLDVEYGDIAIHQDDEEPSASLRNLILSDEEAFSQLILYNCLSRLALDLPEYLEGLGIDPDSSSGILESKGRFLPKQYLEHFLYLYQAGLGFAEGLEYEGVRYRIEKIQYTDLDHASAMHLTSKPESLFVIKDQRCLLAKAEKEWLALLLIQHNSLKGKENQLEFEKILAYVDQIKTEISNGALPLNEISIGIVADNVDTFENIRVRIEDFVKTKLPTTKIETWFRQKEKG